MLSSVIEVAMVIMEDICCFEVTSNTCWSMLIVITFYIPVTEVVVVVIEGEGVTTMAEVAMAVVEEADSLGRNVAMMTAMIGSVLTLLGS